MHMITIRKPGEVMHLVLDFWENCKHPKRGLYHKFGTTCGKTYTTLGKWEVCAGEDIDRLWYDGDTPGDVICRKCQGIFLNIW